MSTVPPSPPCPITRTSVRPFTFSAAATPVATAGALPNSEWIHGSCHALSGYGVVKTSRQPVALAAIRRPPAARIAASSTNRAPSASPQPWQARWPEVSAFERLGSDLHRALVRLQQAVAHRERARPGST